MDATVCLKEIDFIYEGKKNRVTVESNANQVRLIRIDHIHF